MDDIQDNNKATEDGKKGVIPSLRKTPKAPPKKWKSGGLTVEVFTKGSLDDFVMIQFLNEFASTLKEVVELKKQIGYLMGYAEEVEHRLGKLEGGAKYVRGEKDKTKKEKGKNDKGRSFRGIR